MCQICFNCLHTSDVSVYNEKTWVVLYSCDSYSFQINITFGGGGGGVATAVCGKRFLVVSASNPI